MAIITKTRHIKLTDDNGVAQTGKTVIFYPAGTAANGTTASEVSGLAGVYAVVLDPTDPDGNIIDRRYDVWWDSAKKLDDEEIGYWFFTITVTMTSDTYTITYASEDDLPSPIPNATMIGNPVPMEDRGVRLYSISDTVAVIKATGTGSYVINASNTMDVTVTIRGG
jgi:hypothetical protein